MKTAWVISGGGARFVQALDIIEQHVKAGGKMPDALYGTSAGALLSFMLARMDIEAIKYELGTIHERKDIFGGDGENLALGKRGLWNYKPLLSRLTRIAKLPVKIPHTSCVVNLFNYDTEYMDHKCEPKYHVASACIPVLIEPVESYVDGGLTENLPIRKAIEDGATHIEVFSCSAAGSGKWVPVRDAQLDKKYPPIISTIIRCFNAMREEIGRGNIPDCPKGVTINYHYPKKDVLDLLDFDKVAGYFGDEYITKKPVKKRVRRNGPRR